MLDEVTTELSISHLDEFLDAKTGHLVYYYPYEMADPERFMPLVGDAAAAWRSSAGS